MVLKRFNSTPNWRWLIPPLLIIALLLIFSGTLVHLLTEGWWFSAIGFSGVFWTLVQWRTLIWLGSFVSFALFLGLNYWFAMKVSPYSNIRVWGDASFYVNRVSRYLAPIIIFFISLSAAGASISSWETILKFFNATPFERNDPIFDRDIGFYIFELPFYERLQTWLFALLLMGLLVAVAVYLVKGAINLDRGWKYLIEGEPKAHLCLLLTGLSFLLAFQFWLQRYNLLYSVEGAVFGAGYTDTHARLAALKFMGIIALVLGVIFIASAARNTLLLPAVGIGLSILIYVGFHQLYPSLQQQLVVEPNELNREKPYIEHNIEFTRDGYNLEKVKPKQFPAKGELDRADLSKNDDTIHNIRLWDYRPLLTTYRQLQQLRPYYTFSNVDVDRYTIDGDYRQVSLSGRELERAPSEQWVTQRLRYTHGFGLVMSPVNRVSSQGLPEFWIKDIPPQTNTDLEIDQSRIYYGEQTNNYIFTGTTLKEFDYPTGGDNTETQYAEQGGKGGIALNSLLRKLAYSYNLGDFRLLISDYFTSNSRIHYHRNIRERINQVAPFLRLDSDPYLTLVDGKLKWIVEGYTVSDHFPYSQPVTRMREATQILQAGSTRDLLSGGFNYVRNSVKVVVDALDGTVQLFAIDQQDPILETYQKIFPDLIRSPDAIPAELKSHFRYPLELFEIQNQMYLEYHMTNPDVFYDQEDLWRVPNEQFKGQQQRMEPYYMIMRLPETQQEEFVLMLPFTPINRDNMIAWMAARSDGENYGKLLLYEFPKQELVLGPSQIEAQIDQNTEISEQLSLWDQQGSRVIRGNLLVIPIEQSLLYIEPIYLRANQGELPELKQVVVAHDEQLVMRPSLEESLTAIFGQDNPQPVADKEPAEQEGVVADDLMEQVPNELAQEALQVYQDAQKARQQGNWDQYGDKLQELEQILEQLNQQSDD